MKVPLAPTEHPNQVLRKLGSPYDPELPLTFAFGLVGLQRGWKPGSKTWKKNWNACMNCEYDRLIGCRVTSLTTWQQLCAKLGIKDSFKSINQCKKVNHQCGLIFLSLTNQCRPWLVSTWTSSTFWIRGTPIPSRCDFKTRRPLLHTPSQLRSSLDDTSPSKIRSSEFCFVSCSEESFSLGVRWYVSSKADDPLGCTGRVKWSMDYNNMEIHTE